MSLRLPQVGGVYLQAEDECAAMHLCIGASLGGMKAMTATSGPGFILYADPYGWALGCETPMVVLNSGRVGPVSGITGAPGQGEFYLTRYPTQGGNFETVGPGPQLGPGSHGHGRGGLLPLGAVAHAGDGPGRPAHHRRLGGHFRPGKRGGNEGNGLPGLAAEGPPRPELLSVHGRPGYPAGADGYNTGALCSDWTPTEEGYDIEEVEDHHRMPTG